MKKKSIILLFLLYLITPIIVLELFSQFILREKLGKKSIFFRDSYNKKEFMHQPLLLKKYKFKTLYNWQENSEGTTIYFKTDNYGTIFPSALEVANNSSSNSVLFCGGSSIETAYVGEGKRIPDIFGKISNLNAVNSAMSAKGFKGCIKTIDFITKNSKSKPEFIIIAANLNTFGNYAIKKNKSNLKKSKFDNFYIKPSNYFPGLYKSLYILKRKNPFIRNFYSSKKLLKNSYKKYEIIDKQYLLGCCNIASRINKNKEKGFDWESIETKTVYFQYLNAMIYKFEQVIKNLKLKKENIFFFIEPNSYHLDSVASKYDFREEQLLSDKEGVNYSFKKTSEIHQIYDDIYSDTLKKAGFKIIKKPSITNKNVFYDSIHFTEFGSDFIGKYIFKEFMKLQ